MNPVEVSMGEWGIFWDRGRPGIVFGSYAGVTFDKLDPRVLVGILSYELATISMTHELKLVSSITRMKCETTAW